MKNKLVFDIADIVHRDLKLENILLKSIADSTDSLDIKVIKIHCACNNHGVSGS